MDFLEIKKFLAYYQEEGEKGSQILHYNFGIGGWTVSDTDITQLQLVSAGVKIISVPKAVALEAFFQMINEVNDAVKKNLPVPFSDMF